MVQRSPQLTLALESWQEVTGSDLLRGHGPPPTEGGHALVVSPPRRGHHGQGHCGLGRRLSTGLAFLLLLPSEACRGAERKVQKGLRDARGFLSGRTRPFPATGTSTGRHGELRP